MRRFGLFSLWLAVVASGADLLFSLQTRSLSLLKLDQLANMISPEHPLPQQLSAVPSVLPTAIIGIALLVWAQHRQSSRHGYQRRRRPGSR